HPHPFLWTQGQGMIEIGQLPDSEHGEANAINDRGDVVGFAGFHAFLYSQGDMTDLGTLGSVFGSSVAYGINNLGQVVGGTSLGAFNDTASAAFIYSDGVMTNLNTLIPAGFYLDGA